jgi:uncharacterized membrane protein YoaK (UPF0700 family)
MSEDGTDAREPPPSASDSDRAVGTRDALLIGLTFAAGVVDAVSYLGLGHIFTANMTGNVVFLALAVGERSLLTALYSVGALIGFCVGAIVAGRILLRPRPPGLWPRRVTLVLGGELACLAAFAIAWAATGGDSEGGGLIYVLIGLSSVGMGMQNAAARHLAVPGLTTTVVTTALTGLMVDLPALGIAGSAQRRAAWAVLALFSGAAIGAALIVYGRPFAPLVTVATVAVVALMAYRFFDAPARTPG